LSTPSRTRSCPAGSARAEAADLGVEAGRQLLQRRLHGVEHDLEMARQHRERPDHPHRRRRGGGRREVRPVDRLACVADPVGAPHRDQHGQRAEQDTRKAAQPARPTDGERERQDRSDRRQHRPARCRREQQHERRAGREHAPGGLAVCDRRTGGDAEDAACHGRHRGHRVQGDAEQQPASDHTGGRALKRRVISEPNVHERYQRPMLSYRST
jgi:hypothetical protein